MCSSKVLLLDNGGYAYGKITLTRKEAAELLGISRGTVTRWVLEGRLKAYRISDSPSSPFLLVES
ncbi:excisionase family DNA-binding protein [Enterobacter bugandensis]|uniref:excisionase family DNA-binding protein n=1 Tax=Enterobacter bugandensis TaxID=881260 RepID=UPI0018888FA9|nr:excisionase family DNA-binding protein [Enterobacter bugandensis]MBF2747792.1 excisionase family DNA-binding protein [Enterobacter bugandensis]MBF2800668.1 excisionase family DNA-binding protein [Enterobacter bugandensis]